MLSPLLMTAVATVLTTSPVENVQYRGGIEPRIETPTIVAPPPRIEMPTIVAPPPPPPSVKFHPPRSYPVCTDRYDRNGHIVGKDCN